MAPIIEMRQISKRFGAVRALNRIDFLLSSGEIVGLVGENGAGKSTLVKILSGIHQPNEGVVIIDGNEAEIKDVRDAMSRGIGLIHQELNLLDNLDVAGNIFLGREPLGRFGLINKKQLCTDAHKYLDQLGLELSPAHPLSDLSIAVQQMIEIAKALSQNARILIFDEPTSSLTEKETDILFGVIQMLREQRVGIIDHTTGHEL